MEKQRKPYVRSKPREPVYCDIPGCPKANKDMGGIRGLTVHKHFKHGISYPNINFSYFKEKKRETMSENKETSTEHIPDLSKETPTINILTLESKLDALTKMIPPNFCEEFPHLCQLGKRVDDIEERIGELKEAIPKKITVNIPKQILPEIPVPVIDVTALSKSIVDGISPGLKIDTDPLTQAISTELRSLTEVLKQNISKSGESREAEKLIAEITEVENAVHKTAGDYFNCPECRQSLLAALQERINSGKEHDTDVSAFLDNIRTALTPTDEGKHEQHNHASDGPNRRSDSSIATTGEGRSESTGTGEEKSGQVLDATEEVKTADTVAGKTSGDGTPSESQYDDKGRCIGGWCLLRKSRKV